MGAIHGHTDRFFLSVFRRVAVFGIQGGDGAQSRACGSFPDAGIFAGGGYLFVVMMLDINIDSVRKGFWRHFPLALGIGALIAFEMAAVLAGGFGVSQAPEMQATLPGVHAGNAKMLGGLLYTQYLYPIQIAAVILLVAMIAAITLTLRDRKTTKKIDPAIQVRARAADRLVVVSMQATQMAAPEVAPEENAQAPAAEAKK